jgi:hypothetical protein
MTKLLLITAVSFGMGALAGGIIVHIEEGPRPLNAFEQMMVDAQKQHEQQMKDLQKALANSPAPGNMSEAIKNYSGPPELSSGAKKK